MDEKKKKSKAAPIAGANDRVCEHLSFAAKEAFKRLRTNLMLKVPESDRCHIVGVTSAQPSEGKSTIALNLSYSLAELGKKVLLLDADMRRPSIHLKARVERTPGLADLLGDSNSITACIRKYQSSKNETVFDILPGGNIPPNPSELLNSRRMATLLETLRSAYDFIIIDLPPVGAVIDAISVSKNTDGMIVVLRENHCPIGVFKDCVAQIQESNVPILGFVMNGALEGSGKKYGYGYGYGKGYGSYKSYSGYYGNYYGSYYGS
ncbi:MAG: CpsD/CapB family tyrosine-protein kinase [Oscillospiraceae bacterium]|nr:CpsD/CapB family tyrosine-protein kinase [Oscillospiraceae bacterium]